MPPSNTTLICPRSTSGRPSPLCWWGSSSAQVTRSSGHDHVGLDLELYGNRRSCRCGQIMNMGSSSFPAPCRSRTESSARQFRLPRDGPDECTLSTTEPTRAVLIGGTPRRIGGDAVEFPCPHPRRSLPPTGTGPVRQSVRTCRLNPPSHRKVRHHGSNRQVNRPT